MASNWEARQRAIQASGLTESQFEEMAENILMELESGEAVLMPKSEADQLRNAANELAKASAAIGRVRAELDNWKATIDAGVMAGSEWEHCLRVNLPLLLAALGGPADTPPTHLTVSRNDLLLLWSWGREAFDELPADVAPTEEQRPVLDAAMKNIEATLMAARTSRRDGTVKFDVQPDQDGIVNVRHGLGTQAVVVRCETASGAGVGYLSAIPIDDNTVEVATVRGSGVVAVRVEVVGQS